MLKIMFVCTGNVCRSPMAELYLQKKLDDAGKKFDYVVNSCGTSANSGEKASEDAVSVMKGYEVDLKGHKAKSIFDVDITQYDLILTMTEAHKDYIKMIFPDLEEKIFTLKEYSGVKSDYLDIDDPWGLDREVYEDVAQKIVECVDKLIVKI